MKRRQQVQKPCDRASKENTLSEAFVVGIAGATPNLEKPQGEVPAGSESRADVHRGYPGTWESSPVPIVKGAASGFDAG